MYSQCKNATKFFTVEIHPNFDISVTDILCIKYFDNVPITIFPHALSSRYMRHITRKIIDVAKKIINAWLRFLNKL